MTTTATLTPETIASWTNGLNDRLAGLDMSDSDDRATFRGRVNGMSEHTTAARLRELASHFGRPVAGNCSLTDARRALAAAWIAQAQRDADGRTRLTPTHSKAATS